MSSKLLADGYAVLAQCWRRPTESLVRAVNAGEIAVVAPEVESVTVERLDVEHTRLFVGPDTPPCPPYESVYRGENGGVLGSSTQAVVEWYRSFGLVPDPEWPDLPDHVATELEFVGHLIREGEEERAEQFLDEHPRRWLEPFLTDVERETREPFYASLARATRSAVDL